MPIGPRVDGPRPDARDGRRCSGRVVALAPLDPGPTAKRFMKESSGEAGDRLWQYLFEGPFADRAAFDLHLQRIAASEDPLFFAILDKASGSAVGYASYLRIEPVHRVIEVGNILYTPRLQQTTLGHRSHVSDGTACLRRLGVPPLRVEVQCSQRAFAAGGFALRFHLRRDFPATHDRQGKKSGYCMVLHARFRMAGPKS